MAQLTDEQIAEEERFLAGMCPLNIGALFLPPIWGPAHGIWATILVYPIWLLADNSFYAAWQQPTAISITVAVLVFLILTAGTFAFARISQPLVAHKCIDSGKMTKQQYIARQRIWAVVSVAVGCIMIAAATYYNVCIRPGLA